MLCDVDFHNVDFPSDYSHVRDFASSSARSAWFASHKTLSLSDLNYDMRRNSVMRIECSREQYDSFNYCILSYPDQDYYMFIDEQDIVSVTDTGTLVVNLTLRFDDWMNSPLSIRSGDAVMQRCVIEQSHVDRWQSGISTPNIYPVKQGCDGWQLVTSKQNILVDGTIVPDGTPDQSVASVVMCYLADGVIKYAIWPVLPGNPQIACYLTLSDDTQLPLQCPKLADVYSGSNIATYFNIQSTAIMSITLTKHIAIAYKGKGSYIYYPRVLTPGGSYWRPGIVETKSGSDKWCITFDPSSSSGQLVFTKVLAHITPVKPSKPTWSAGGITHSDSYEPGMYQAPVTRRMITDGLGTAYLDIPDTKMLADTLNFVTLPTLGGLNVKVSVELASEIDVTPEGASAVINEPLCDVVTDQWKDFALNQRGLDLEYKKNQAIIQSSTGAASSVANGLVMGNPLGAAAGVMNAIVGAAGEVATYNNDRDYTDATYRNKPNAASIVGDGVGTLINGKYEYYYTIVELDPVSKAEASDRFMLYGYTLRMLLLPNITSRRYYNYIRTRGCRITSTKMTLKHIMSLQRHFDNGMTIWHTDRMTADNVSIYTYAKENIEQVLVS